MTLVSDRIEHAVAPAAMASSRNLSLDRTRSFLTILVLIHHAVIPYTYYGHTDPKSFAGFDAIVLATDSFFMALFFLLSGLFLWPSVAHRAPGVFARDRLIRLGLPFVFAALTIIPIAYYAIALRQSPGLGFAEFWLKTVTVGPWPSGPLWFLWVLLIYSIVGGLLYRLAPQALDPINRLSVRAFRQPVVLFAVFVAVAAVVYVPVRVLLGPNHWLEFGPFSVQTSRILLYAAYFFLGAGIGAANIKTGLLSPEGELPNGWARWAITALVPYCALWGLIYIKREILGNPDMLPDWYEASYAIAFVVFSAAISFAILAFFLRFKTAGRSLLDALQHDAYGIFLVHYAYMLWLQYWLYGYDLPAIAKAGIVFVLGLALSWITTALLRRIPGVALVL
ncbi:acyltransferase family protein [Rhodopseudomonas palustris]|uniref:Acyltransferase 3 n=1 Tax=Rhodopseudomonas palustris (strain BisB18) TaxID=316056 RepID=Q218N2_RHOPB